MTTHAPSASASTKKIDDSRIAMEDFILHQRTWLQRASEAFTEGYFLETITVCIHQLHAIIRRSLWVHSQIQALQKKPHEWRDDYLFQVLDASHDAMEDARDVELYAAAEKFGILDARGLEHLRGLYTKSQMAMRSIFTDDTSAEHTHVIEQIAEELQEVDTRLLDNLEASFDTFSGQLTSLGERHD